MVNEKTETNYQWNGADYAGHSEVQQKWALELMQQLDLGCGDGKVTAALAAGLPDGRVVGVDSSQQTTQERLQPGCSVWNTWPAGRNRNSITASKPWPKSKRNASQVIPFQPLTPQDSAF